MRLSPLLSVVAAESAGRRELECQLQFTIRKLHILHKHAAHEIERVNNTSATVSPAAEVENRRIQSFVMSAKANLNRVRQSAAAAAAEKKKGSEQAARRPSQYEMDMLESRRHVASLAAAAALRQGEGDGRAAIDREQASSRALLTRIYLKNLTQSLQFLKGTTSKHLDERVPFVH